MPVLKEDTYHTHVHMKQHLVSTLMFAAHCNGGGRGYGKTTSSIREERLRWDGVSWRIFDTKMCNERKRCVGRRVCRCV